MFTGTLINCSAIALGGVIGIILGKRLGKRYHVIMMQAVSLAVLLIGLQMALKVENFMVLLISLLLGAILGEFLQLEKNLNKIGQKLQNKLKIKKSNFVPSFITASVIFCTGAMAIVGAIEEGVKNDSSILYAKALIDGVASIAFGGLLIATIGLNLLNITKIPVANLLPAFLFAILISSF